MKSVSLWWDVSPRWDLSPHINSSLERSNTVLTFCDFYNNEYCLDQGSFIPEMEWAALSAYFGILKTLL